MLNLAPHYVTCNFVCYNKDVLLLLSSESQTDFHQGSSIIGHIFPTDASSETITSDHLSLMLHTFLFSPGQKSSRKQYNFTTMVDLLHLLLALNSIDITWSPDVAAVLYVQTSLHR